MKRLLIFGLAATALMGYAETVTLTRGDNNATTTSFNGVGGWSDGLSPHDDADYLVALGTGSVIRTPNSNSGDYSCTFAGNSLQLGEVGGAKGKLIHKSKGNCVITHNNLILANGQYSHGDGSQTCNVKGTCTVISPESAPFQMQGSGNGGDRKMLWNVAMTGDVGTMFEVSRTSGENDGRYICFLGGDNTGYFGKMQANGANMYLGFSNTEAVGGPLETFTPDAINLVNKGVLSAADTDGVVIARENGGITADDSGCTIFVGNRVDFKATFQMPIIGGPMEKRGSGIAIFDAAWNAGNLTVTQGSFGFTQGIEIGADCTTFTTLAGATFSADQDQLNGRTMLNNGSFNPAGIGTVGSVTLGSGHTVSNLMFDVSLSDSDCVTLTEAENVTAWPMQIGLTGYGMAQRYPVLKIPTSIRTVTLEDFIDVSVADPREQVTSSIAIETDDDTGIQTVYLCQSFQVINQIVNDKYFTDATAWEDGQAAHAGAAYVTYAKLLRTSVGTANDVTFPGESLYIYGNSGTRADLRIKDKSLTVNDLRMGQKTIVTGGAGSSGVTSQTLYGNVTILAPDNMKANFATEANRTFTVAANLHGTGCACATSYSTTSRAYVYVTGDNTDFTGTWQIGDNERTSSGYPIMYISSKANIGSNPATRQAHGLYIYNYGVLSVQESLTLDDENRVVCFNNGFVEVPEGKTLTITSETVWNGKATKTGAGTLALGNEKRTSNAKNMDIKAGYFKPLTVEAIGGLQLTFYNGSAYLLDKDPADELLGEFGLVDGNNSAITLADGAENLQVEIDFGGIAPYGSFSVPLFSITAAAAEKIRGKIAVANCPRSYTVTIQEDVSTWTSTSSGTTTEFQRFSAVFTDISGTIIMLK